MGKKLMNKKVKNDFIVSRESPQASVVLFQPLTRRAREWVEDNVQLESWQWLGDAFTVDWRFVDTLLLGIATEGLSYALEV